MLSVVSNINTGIKHSHLEVGLKSKDDSLKLLDKLWDAKLINGYSVKEPYAIIYLSYGYFGGSNVKKLFFSSKPGMRKYIKKRDLKKLKRKNNVVIISTDLGLVLLEEALSLGLGGEVVLIGHV